MLKLSIERASIISELIFYSNEIIKKINYYPEFNGSLDWTLSYKCYYYINLNELSSLILDIWRAKNNISLWF